MEAPVVKVGEAEGGSSGGGGDCDGMDGRDEIYCMDSADDTAREAKQVRSGGLCGDGRAYGKRIGRLRVSEARGQSCQYGWRSRLMAILWNVPTRWCICMGRVVLALRVRIASPVVWPAF